jgi:hypothetical protein
MARQVFQFRRSIQCLNIPSLPCPSVSILTSPLPCPQAFSAWVAKTDLQRSVRHFAALLRNRAQLSAFNTWRAAVQESRQMEQDLHQVSPPTAAHRREKTLAPPARERWFLLGGSQILHPSLEHTGRRHRTAVAPSKYFSGAAVAGVRSRRFPKQQG